MFFPTYPHLEKTGHDRSATSLSRFPHSTQLQLRLLHNSCNRQPRSTRNWLQFGSVAGLLSVRQLDFKTLVQFEGRDDTMLGYRPAGWIPPELLGHENWAKVLRVDAGKALIPFFGVDIPASSERVGFRAKFTGAEAND